MLRPWRGSPSSDTAIFIGKKAGEKTRPIDIDMRRKRLFDAACFTLPENARRL